MRDISSVLHNAGPSVETSVVAVFHCLLEQYGLWRGYLDEVQMIDTSELNLIMASL